MFKDLSRRAIQIQDTMCRVSLWVACSLAVTMVGLICLEVFLRDIFNISLKMVDEYVAYMLIAVTFYSLGTVASTRAHVRVTLLFNRYPQTFRDIANVLVDILGLLLISLMIYWFTKLSTYSFQHEMKSYQVSATPLYLPQAIPIPGMVILALQHVRDLVSHAWKLRSAVSMLVFLRKASVTD